jgi:hypothetical protein
MCLEQEQIMNHINNEALGITLNFNFFGADTTADHVRSVGRFCGSDQRVWCIED